jgi:hypothetical protein
MTRHGKLTAGQLELVQKQQLANILRKVAKGRTLTAREQQILESAAAEKRPEGRQGRQSEENDAAVWLTPAAFLRWLPSQGLQLSRKNFYKTYYGSRARHPVHTSSDGKRIHKLKALELVRLIQAKDAGDDDADRVIRERQQAEAMFKNAQAIRQVIALETMLGQRLRRDLVGRVWSQAVENLKNELRTIEHNGTEEIIRRVLEAVSLDDATVNLLRARVRSYMQDAHHACLKHMTVSYGDDATAANGANAGAASSAA